MIGKHHSFSSDLCSLMKVNAGFDIDLQTDLWKQNHATFKSEIRTLPVPVFMSSWLLSYHSAVLVHLETGYHKVMETLWFWWLSDTIVLVGSVLPLKSAYVIIFSCCFLLMLVNAVPTLHCCSPERIECWKFSPYLTNFKKVYLKVCVDHTSWFN